MILEVIELRVKALGFEHAEQVSRKIIELYEKGEFDVATLFFSRFKSVISQIPTALQIIPPVFESAVESAPSAVYEYEPDELDILAELLPRNISVQVFRAILENAASEQGARMSAMDNATRNASRWRWACRRNSAATARVTTRSSFSCSAGRPASARRSWRSPRSTASTAKMRASPAR
jgi:F-type H+-transporting ATPase subunit gamma